MTIARTKTLLPAAFLVFLICPLTGCSLTGALTGAALREPEITTDLIPPDPNALTMITFVDGRKQKARFVAFEPMSEAAYRAHFDSMSAQSLPGGFPDLGDPVEVMLASDSSRVSGRFAGYSGLQSGRLGLYSTDGNLREWPLYDLLSVRSVDAAPVGAQEYRNLARANALPSRSVYVARFDAEAHRIPANDIRFITKRVRPRRILVGFGIGFALDLLVGYLIHQQYPDGLFGDWGPS